MYCAETLINPDVITLTGRLDNLPLAIVIAGAYMRETGTSISEYLDYYQKSWRNLQSYSRPERQYQNGNMLQTWLISYNEIKKRDLNAAKLILLLARFDNRDIWYELVKCGAYSTNQPVWFNSVISDSLSFKKTMKSLIEFSLIEASQRNGSYTMHPVVQDWCLHIILTEHDVKASRLDDLALVCVGYMVPSNDEQNYWELQRRLLIHADYIYQKRNIDQLNGDIAVWKAFNGLGNLYSDQGKLREAEEMYQRALAGCEKALGLDHIFTLDSVNNLGILYCGQGNLKKAEEMYQRALAGCEKALGPDHISTLGSVNNLGNLYRDQGKLKEAEEMYRRALAGCENALGPDHTSTLGSVNNLGNLYLDQGKLKEAEEMYRRALAGYEKAQGPDHTSTLDSVNNLGVLYHDQGNLKKAEEMYQRALAGCENALGPDHISTLGSVNNLGNLYRDQGKLKEAEEMYQRALAGYEKVLGSDHISTLNSIYNLGVLYRDQGKLKEEGEMYQRALAGCENALGPDHHKTERAAKKLKRI
jgi:tetratricopeptide (TPR) repeat protein